MYIEHMIIKRAEERFIQDKLIKKKALGANCKKI